VVPPASYIGSNSGGCTSPKGFSFFTIIVVILFLLFVVVVVVVVRFVLPKRIPIVTSFFSGS
jgi:hypothetical protein